MVRAVMMGTMSLSAVSVSFSVSEPRKSEPGQQSDREPSEEREGWLVTHTASSVLIRQTVL